MAIKKQKRSLEEANLAPAQNGAGKKHQKQLKNVKIEKSQKPQEGAPSKKLQKPNVKVEVEKSAKKVKLGDGEQPAKKLKKEIETAPASAKLPKASEAKKAEKLLKKNENRKEARKEKGQYKSLTVTLKPEEIKKKIEEIQSRSEVTKTAKRRLGVLKKKLAIAEGTFVSKAPLKSDVPVLSKSKRRHDRRKRAAEKKLALAIASGASKPVDIQNSKKKTLEKQQNKTNVKNEVIKSQDGVVKPEKLTKDGKKQPKGKELKKLPIKKEEPEVSEDDDDDDEEEEEEEDSDEEMADSSAEILNTSEEQSEDEEDDDEDDDEDDNEDDDDEDDDEDDDDDDIDEEEVKFAFPEKKIKLEVEKKPVVKKEAMKKEFKKDQVTNGDEGKKKRFVLFVGNLSYQATADDIKNHFLTKVSAVASVRVPTKPGSNSPRGIAYVELTNEEDYQKALSLHNTNINGRRINVEYTQGGSKSVGNRSEIVSKNKKLHAMRKGGMLAGKRDNRNDRRQKARQQGPA